MQDRLFFAVGVQVHVLEFAPRGKRQPPRQDQGLVSIYRVDLFDVRDGRFYLRINNGGLFVSLRVTHQLEHLQRDKQQFLSLSLVVKGLARWLGACAWSDIRDPPRPPNLC